MASSLGECERQCGDELRERFARLPAEAVEGRLTVEQGDWGDYLGLAEYHYKGSAPATVSRVFVAKHFVEGVSDRFMGRTSGERVVGVLVESMPVLGCRMRDWALGGRYGGVQDRRQRATLVNREVRCISRVVVHPQWRGLGVAVRLVGATLAAAATVYTEAMAAMGRVHPFFERAGMTAYRRHRHEHDARLIAALGAAGVEPDDLAALRGVCRRIAGLPVTQKAWLLRELGAWHKKTLGWAVQKNVGHYDLLLAAQGRLVCEPVYYLKDNRGELGVDTKSSVKA